MLDYSPTKTQKLLGNPDKSANPTASSLACAGSAGEHCIRNNPVEFVENLRFVFEKHLNNNSVLMQNDSNRQRNENS